MPTSAERTIDAIVGELQAKGWQTGTVGSALGRDLRAALEFHLRAMEISVAAPASPVHVGDGEALIAAGYDAAARRVRQLALALNVDGVGRPTADRLAALLAHEREEVVGGVARNLPPAAPAVPVGGDAHGDLDSLCRELAKIVGPGRPPRGVGRVEYWISRVGEGLARAEAVGGDGLVELLTSDDWIQIVGALRRYGTNRTCELADRILDNAPYAAARLSSREQEARGS